MKKGKLEEDIEKINLLEIITQEFLEREEIIFQPN